MVAITANCDWLATQDPTAFLWKALAIGAVGGVAAYVTANFVRDKLRVDDPVEAVGVHAGVGAAGMLMAAFRKPDVFGQFVVQLIALVAAGAWVGTVMVPVLLLLRMRAALRCSEAEESFGLTFESFDTAVLTGEAIKEFRSHVPAPSDPTKQEVEN